MEPVRSDRGCGRSRFAIVRIIARPLRRMAFLQFAAYVIIGGICFSIDITGFVIFLYLGLGILTASAISFVTATIANYLLCCTFVFQSGRFSRSEELLRLFAIAVIGLSLNSAMVWLLAEVLALNPILAKILAVLPVLAWNYLGRRSVVFGGAPSTIMIKAAQGARESF